MPSNEESGHTVVTIIKRMFFKVKIKQDLADSENFAAAQLSHISTNAVTYWDFQEEKLVGYFLKS